MTRDHLDAILTSARFKADPEREGWEIPPDRASLALYLAHDGVALTANRIEALKRDGELLYARSQKGEVFAVTLADLFAVSVDESHGEGAKNTRRAGFG